MSVRQPIPQPQVIPQQPGAPQGQPAAQAQIPIGGRPAQGGAMPGGAINPIAMFLQILETALAQGLTLQDVINTLKTAASSQQQKQQGSPPLVQSLMQGMGRR